MVIANLDIGPNGRRLLFVLLFVCFGIFGAVAHARSGGGSSGTFAVPAQLVDKWSTLDGREVKTITIDGLERTREITMNWMMATKVGLPFSAESLARDLQLLFNTGNLYDLVADVVPDETNGVAVHVILKDKWTLFPVIGAQGGGGSMTLGGGVFESNLLGYMANASLLIWTFNGANSYDVNMNQEYFRGTQTMWSIDNQNSIEPQTVHYYSGLSAGQFAWRRQQTELMLGTHLRLIDTPVRAMFYGSVYQDSIFNNDGGFNINTGPGLQQRVYPKAIFGRDDWTNFLENGFELTIQPTFANFIGGGPQYVALEVDFKRVWIVGSKRQDNLAMYVSTSSMGNGGPDFQYNIGGYYNVRGYVDLREFGRRIAFANFEYRPYLFGYRFHVFNADLMAVQGCVFTDTGSAWGDSSLTGEAAVGDFRPLWSAGLGIRINMVKFAGALMRLDWARTISPDEGIGFSFGVGQFF